MYAVGATTVDPLFIRSPFELFINPLTDVKPEYKIVFADEPTYTPEEEEMDDGELLIKRAVKSGILMQKKLKTDYGSHPGAHAYQFVNEVLSETNGNEQAIELLSRMGGFTYAEADLFRRSCGASFSEKGIRYGERKKNF